VEGHLHQQATQAPCWKTSRRACHMSTQHRLVCNRQLIPQGQAAVLLLHPSSCVSGRPPVRLCSPCTPGPWHAPWQQPWGHGVGSCCSPPAAAPARPHWCLEPWTPAAAGSSRPASPAAAGGRPQGGDAGPRGRKRRWWWGAQQQTRDGLVRVQAMGHEEWVALSMCTVWRWCKLA
jgi:hypothetical protein